MRGITPRAQADAGMGEVKRQLIYKSLWRPTVVTLGPVWYPSSKTCSACRAVNAKLKRERTWTCGTCGTSHDRNLNAALNLRNLILPPGRGRRSVTGRLWPFRKGRVEPARMIGEQHRPTPGKDKADCVFTECTHALADLSSSHPAGFHPPADFLTQIVTPRKWLPQPQCCRKLGRQSPRRWHHQPPAAGRNAVPGLRAKGGGRRQSGSAPPPGAPNRSLLSPDSTAGLYRLVNGRTKL